MDQKPGTFARVQQMARANLNAMLDRAENPQLMLDQMVRDYHNSVADAEQQITLTVGQLRMAQDDLARDQKDLALWSERAKSAAAQLATYRASGDEATAAKFDSLAKAALTKQVALEEKVATEQEALQVREQQAEQLKQGLVAMKEKLRDLGTRRDTMVARAKAAQATAMMNSMESGVNLLDPSSNIGKYEEQIKKQEALARGQVELGQMAGLGDLFEAPQIDSSANEVEARLAALMANTPQPQLTEQSQAAVAEPETGEVAEPEPYDLHDDDTAPDDVDVAEIVEPEEDLSDD